MLANVELNVSLSQMLDGSEYIFYLGTLVGSFDTFIVLHDHYFFTISICCFDEIDSFRV